KGEGVKKSKADTISWEGVDRDLFEALRELRRQLAQSRQVPPYVIFSDATLRELAQVRPATLEKMRLVYGVGDNKLHDFGERFLHEIATHCAQRSLSKDNPVAARAPELPAKSEAELGATTRRAFALFRRGASIEMVMQQTERSRSAVQDYLCEFIRREQ